MNIFHLEHFIWILLDFSLFLPQNKSYFQSYGNSSPTSRMHNVQSLCLQVMKFKMKLDPLILYNFHLEHFLKIIRFSHEMIALIKSVQNRVLHTYQFITWVLLPQLRWNLCRNFLDLKWNNFHLDHFSSNSP